jgi:subtilisin family serine protease
LIGLVDSGVGHDPNVAGARAFRLEGNGSISAATLEPDVIGHGSSIAATIAAAAPASRLVVAQVFRGAMTTPAAVVAAALEWLMSKEVRLVNMSFGLARDREVLRDACAAARAAGLLLVAASPARGPRAFPAAYPGMIRVSGDARCPPGAVSLLEEDPPLFGACPRSIDDRVRGASAAAAHVTGLVAAWMHDRREASLDEALDQLRSVARHRGRERRGDELAK